MRKIIRGLANGDQLQGQNQVLTQWPHRDKQVLEPQAYDWPDRSGCELLRTS